MQRFLLSLMFGLVVGAGMGLWLGWGPWKVIYVQSPMSHLAGRFRDDYTVMVADGYRVDRDLAEAVQRLLLLGKANHKDNVPLYVQETAERFITQGRDLNDIRSLVILSRDLGRLTPLMERFLLPATPAP